MSDQLVELVNRFHQFEKGNPGCSIGDFCKDYLMQQSVNKPEAEKFLEEGKIPPIHKTLGRSLGRLSKLGLFYGKRIMADLQLNNFDDFLYLEGTKHLGAPTKKELIETFVNEYSSGIEIIRRLVNMGLLKEFPDETDRRLSRVSITKKGSKTLDACYPNMIQMGNMMYSPLTAHEKEQLATLLSRLDKIHYTAYSQSKTKELAELKSLIMVLSKDTI